MLEGIALTMQRHTAAMAAELGREVRRLVVSGGGAQSELMLQILADAFDRPVTRTRSTSAASLGAAICAAVGVGAHPSFGAATSALVHPDVVVEPRAEGAQRYAELSSVHASLVTAIDPVLRRTDDLPFG